MSPREEKKEKGERRIFEEIMAKNFQIKKKINLHIQEIP